MKFLETDHQYTPAYHARGNQAERVNRWPGLGETLRRELAAALLPPSEVEPQKGRGECSRVPGPAALMM